MPDIIYFDDTSAINRYVADISDLMEWMYEQAEKDPDARAITLAMGIAHRYSVIVKSFNRDIANKRAYPLN